MPSAILGPVAGAVVGGLMSDSGGGSQQVTKNEPWGPAQEPLKNILSDAEKLRQYYQQTPFNQLQKTSYQNLAGDLDNYRQSIAPSMMTLSNRLMNSNYQRAPAGSELGGFLQPERSMGAGMGGMGGMGQAAGSGQGGALGGLLGQAGQGFSSLANGGLLGGISGALGGGGSGQDMGQGVGQGMQMALGQQQRNPPIPTMTLNPGTPYGQIDFAALNPWTSGAIPEPKAPESNTGNLSDDELEYLRRQYAQDKFRRDQYGDFGGGGA